MTSRFVIVFLSVLMAVVAGACSSESKAGEHAVLVFSAIPDQNATNLQQKYEPLAEYLSEKLGVKVEYHATADYDATVEAFKNGDVHLASFGGLSGVQARTKVEGSRAIAQGVIDPEFLTYFIAHRDTGIEPSDEFPMDLAGKSFAFGSKKSTSGRLMPEHWIREKSGKDPAAFLGSDPRFSGGHDLTATWVADGTVQAGALNYQVYDRMVKDGEIDPEIVRVIWTTPPYPDYNWTAHPDLEGIRAGLIDELQRALVELDDPVLLELIDRKDGLIEANNEDFQPIADLADPLGFLDV